MFTSRGALAEINPDGMERIVVFGDIHGDLRSLRRGLEHWGKRDLLIFLGDYADRGTRGVEVIEEIDTLLNRHPQRVIALKGNHEEFTSSGEPIFSPCTLTGEASEKRESWETFWPFFSRFLSKLHISALLPGFAFFTHGGLSSKLVSIEQLEDPKNLAGDLLWSDPVKIEGESPNPRGMGTLFGPGVSSSVLSSLGTPALIRSHEPKKASHGPYMEHEGRVITINTNSVYDGRPFILVLDPSHPPAEQITSPEQFPGAVCFLDD